MDKSRRNFLKKALAGLGITFVGSATLSHLLKGNSQKFLSESTNTPEINSEKISIHTPDDPQRHWGFLIDLSKCNGCIDQDPPEDDPTREKPLCSYACRISHYYLLAAQNQEAMYWIRVYEQQENPHSSPYYFPKPCMNCEDPPCLRVCPTGATFKRKDGTVLINHKICIGCRFCMAACPYETRFFWYKEPIIERDVEDYEYSPEHPVPHTRGTVVKCDFCLHMAYNGQLPSCVTACPRGALYFGDLNQDAVSNGLEVVPVRQTLEENGGFRYKEDEKTNPSTFYLPHSATSETGIKTKVDLDIEILSSKSSNSTEIRVFVREKTGNPISFAKVAVSRQTSFGQAFVAKGKTDSNGNFLCSFHAPHVHGQIIIAEMVETNQYSQIRVRKHVD